MATRGLRTFFTVLRIALAFGLLFYLGFSGAIQWSALLHMADAWPLSLVALCLLLSSMILLAFRLRLLLKPRGFDLSPAASIRLTLIGVFFNNCLPGSASGDFVKIYYATKGNQGRRLEVTTIILLDRAIGMFALLVWPLLAVPFFADLTAGLPILRGLLWGGAAVAAAMVAGLWVGSSQGVLNHPWTTRALARIPMGRHIENILRTLHGYRAYPAVLLGTIGLSLVVQTLVIGATLLATMAMQHGDVAWQMVLLMPLGFLANVLPLTPGGLGVGEAAFDTLFSLAGLSGGAETLLGWRLLTLLIGLLGLVFYLQGRKRFVYDEPQRGQQGASLAMSKQHASR